MPFVFWMRSLSVVGCNTVVRCKLVGPFSLATGQRPGQLLHSVLDRNRRPTWDSTSCCGVFYLRSRISQHMITAGFLDPYRILKIIVSNTIFFTYPRPSSEYFVSGGFAIMSFVTAVYHGREFILTMCRAP